MSAATPPEIQGEQADARFVDVAELVEAAAVESERADEVGREAAVVIGVHDLAARASRHRHPTALAVAVDEDGLARRPVGETADKTVDQSAPFGCFEPAQYGDPLVEAHPQFVTRDPQRELFKTHVRVASCG